MNFTNPKQGKTRTWEPVFEDKAVKIPPRGILLKQDNIPGLALLLTEIELIHAVGLIARAKGKPIPSFFEYKDMKDEKEI